MPATAPVEAAAHVSVLQPVESEPGQELESGPSGTPAPATVASTLSKPQVPLIDIPGCDTYTNDTELVVVFRKGLFCYRCEFAEAAASSLDMVVSSLTAAPPVERLLIEGHTDNEPIPSGSPYADNFALGFARATVVAARLRAYPGIPPKALVASSVGANDPPFPNSDYDSRLRNRTVVLRVRFAGEQTDIAP